jgi:Domain of unknown function (DUF1735)
MENNYYKKISGMKRNNINRFLKLGFVSLLVAGLGSSCVKSREGRTDFDNLQPTVLISDGGLSNLTSAAILFPPTDDVDTAFFHVNYAATSTAPADETVTLAVDQDALNAYNAQGGSQYEIFPDSIYSFTATSVTIPKGANYTGNIPLVMFPSKINLLKSYMLPISIKTASSGSTISSNFKTIYFHLIGNPIAGIYNWDWTRWNNTTPTGPTSGGSPYIGLSTVFAPLDETTVTVPSGYYIQPRYIITFTDSSGVLIDFGVTFNSDDIATMAGGGVTITAAPKFTILDPVNGIYQIEYQALTGSGPRYVIDKYYK